MKNDRDTYINALDGAEIRFKRALSEGWLPMMTDAEADELHVTLDALALLRESIARDWTLRPWEDYR